MLLNWLKRFCTANRMLCLLQCFIGIACTDVLGQVNIQTYTVSEGLPQTQVTCIAEDAVGKLWIGTFGGFASFDGVNFKTTNITSGLASNFVSDLLIEKSILWIATQKGISSYDGRDVKNYPMKLGSSQYPVKLFKNLDTLFFLLNGGGLAFLINDSIYTDIKSKNWDPDATILKNIPGTTIIYQHTKNELVILKGDTIKKIHTVEFKKLYSVILKMNHLVISTDKGLFQIEDRFLKFLNGINYPIMTYDKFDDNWATFNNNDLTLINNYKVTFSKNIGTAIRSNYVDSEGLLWLGTDRGLMKVSFPSFHQLGNDIEKNDPVISVNNFADEIWVGTSNQRLKIYLNNNLVKQINFNLKKGNFVNTIKTNHDGKIYIGTTDGLATYQKNKKSINWLQPDSIKGVGTFDFDEHNNVFVSKPNGGAYWIQDEQVQAIKALDKEVVWAVKYNTRHNFFALATNSGLKKAIGTKVEPIIIDELRDAQLSSLNWLTEDILAIGTFGKGAYIYSFISNSVIKINESNGLNSNTLFFVYGDQNKLWCGTEKGIDLVYFNKNWKLVNKIIHFGEIDGLKGLETNLDVVIKKDSGILVGLVTGLYQFKGLQPANQNKLHLETISLFYNKMVSQTIDGSITSHSFKNNENHLTFTFLKTNKRNPYELYYKYKLNGFDQVSSNPSQTNTVTYSNLPPAHYQFSVSATDRSGTFVFDRYEYSFSIEPSFYQTLPFKIAVAILFVLFIFGITIYIGRKRLDAALTLQEIQDQEKTKLRKEIARDFHDELGNQTARLINFVGLLKIKEKIDNSTFENLNSFAQNISGGTKDFVWALDPKNDDLSNIIIHLKDFGERLFVEKKIEFSFHGKLPEGIILPTGHGRQINLIFKEAMTNAFKHANASEIDLIFEQEKDYVFIIFKDNGKGVNIEEIEKSNRGFDNMRFRSKKIGADLKIFSHEKGLSIYLNFKIPNTRENKINPMGG